MGAIGGVVYVCELCLICFYAPNIWRLYGEEEVMRFDWPGVVRDLA